jgi:hypothetical protein
LGVACRLPASGLGGLAVACANVGGAAEGEAEANVRRLYGSAWESTLLAEAEGRRRKAAAQAIRPWLRERSHGGSAWESNPACPQLREATDFEDREGHRAPFASGKIV